MKDEEPKEETAHRQKQMGEIFHAIRNRIEIDLLWAKQEGAKK